MGKVPKKSDTEIVAGELAAEQAMRDSMERTVDVFKQAFLAGELGFGACDLSVLPVGTQAYVGTFLVERGLGFEVCDLVVDGVYLFRVDDPLIGFLYHDSVSEFHVWINKDFSDGLNPSAVYWYIQCMSDENAVVGRV